MTKEEAIKIAEEKYPLPKKQNYKNTIEDNIDYLYTFQTQRYRRQAFVEGILYALDPNNI